MAADVRRRPRPSTRTSAGASTTMYTSTRRSTTPCASRRRAASCRVAATAADAAPGSAAGASALMAADATADARADACHLRRRRRIFYVRRHHVGGRRSACALYAAAVADIYNVDESKVIVTFTAYRRRLQSSGDVVVSYQVLYASAAAATAAANATSSHTRLHLSIGRAERRFEQGSLLCFRRDDRPNRSNAGHGDDAAAIAASAVFVGRRGGGDDGGIIIIIVLVVVVLVLVGVAAYLYWKKRKGTGGTRSRPARSRSSAFAAGTAAGAATGADAGGPTMEVGGPTLSAMEIDILGPLSGILTALPAAAPPPLNMCLMPFTSALAELGLAVRQVRFNKEAAALLQRRGVEIAQKLQDRRPGDAGPADGTGRGRRSDSHGHRPGARRGGQVSPAVLAEGRV